MNIYFCEMEDYNCVICAEEEELIIWDCAPSGMLDDKVDIYSNNAFQQLQDHFKKINDDGDLNDFYNMPGERVKINSELLKMLQDGKLVFSEGKGIIVYSVELKDDYTDDTFNGSLEECHSYCEEHNYQIGNEARIAKVLLDENFHVVETLDIILQEI